MPPRRIDWAALRSDYSALVATEQEGQTSAPVGVEEYQRDAAEERAAILEYDAGLSRQEAERLAGLPASAQSTRPHE